MTGQAVDAVQRSRAGQQSPSTLPGRLLQVVLLLGLLQGEQEDFSVTKRQSHSCYNKSLPFLPLRVCEGVCVCTCMYVCPNTHMSTVNYLMFVV